MTERKQSVARRADKAPIATAWDYAPAPEARDIVRIPEQYGLFIGGKFVEPLSGERYPTIDPAREEPLSEIAQANKADVNRAVKAARGAFEGTWSKLRPSERAKYLFRIARILQERSREFAVLESLNGGKPIRESRDVDIPLAAAHFFYYAGWADKLEYAFPNRRPRPIGVAGQIIPWNFPLLMLAWKVAPALAAGNTVVLKPAETTPLSALLFCDVLRQAELPPGVVNIITGDGRTGAELVKSEGVDKIAFTGSTEVGKAIQRELAGTGKKLTLELGGKAANIIFDDAALDQAVEGIINGIYFNQGHVCCAGSRLLVQESIYEPVVQKLKRRLETLRARPLDPHVPHARGGGREGEQHAVRPQRGGLDGEGLTDPLDGSAAAGRRRLGEHVQPLRPVIPVRRLQGVRLRPRGRTPRARAVPGPRRCGDLRWLTGFPSRRRTSCSSAAPSHAPSRAAPTRRKGRTSRARHARTSATPSAPPAGLSRSGRG